MKTPNCPDCKTAEYMEKIDSVEQDYKGDGITYEEPVYKCYKCGVEWETYDGEII